MALDKPPYYCLVVLILATDVTQPSGTICFVVSQVPHHSYLCINNIIVPADGNSIGWVCVISVHS